MPAPLSPSAPLTSVILVTFHTGAPLLPAIHCVLRQTVPVELIIVDNGNPETAIAQIREIAANDSRVTIVSGHGNIGFSRGNNIGAAIARGDYILLVNPDSELPADALEKFHRHAERLSGLFMIGPRIVNQDGSNQRGCRRALLTPVTASVEALGLYKIFPQARLNKHEEPIPATLSPMPAISGACMFLPRAAFDHIGGFDEDYFLHVEDLDFCFRFRKAGGHIFFAPDILVTHIQSTSDVPSAFAERHKRNSFIRYFHKHFGLAWPLLWGLDIAIWLRYFMRRNMKKPAKFL